LPDDDYVAVYLSLHELSKGPKEAAPGTICQIPLGGRVVRFVSLAWDKRIEDRASWTADVLKSVRDPKTNIEGRIALISLLGEEPETNDAARRVLTELLARDRSPTIRAACADALGTVVTSESSERAIATLLLGRLAKDKSDV